MEDEEVVVDFDDESQTDIDTNHIHVNVSPLNITSTELQFNELGGVIFTRVKMIENGHKIFIDTKETDVKKIAIEELIQGRCPLEVQRQIRSENGTIDVERIPVSQLIIPETLIMTIRNM